MPDYTILLISVAIALLGGYFTEKFHFPGGALLGSMIGVVAVNIIFGRSYFNPLMKIIMMIASGFTIGSSISRDDIKSIPELIIPIVMVSLFLLLYCLGMGTLMSKVTSLDLVTSLFSMVPGGVADMAAISEGLGSDSVLVSILQIWRLFVIYAFIPPFFRILTHTKKEDVKERENHVEKQYEPIRIVFSLLCAAVGGLIFSITGMSTSFIVGAILGSGIFGCVTKKVEIPVWIKFCVKIISGMYMGTRITLEVIKTLYVLAIPALIMFVGMFVSVVFLAFILSKLTVLNFKSGLIASTPGGVQEMFFLAEEIGAESSKTALIQTMRVIAVYLIYPVVLEAYAGLMT